MAAGLAVALRIWPLGSAGSTAPMPGPSAGTPPILPRILQDVYSTQHTAAHNGCMHKRWDQQLSIAWILHAGAQCRHATNLAQDPAGHTAHVNETSYARTAVQPTDNSPISDANVAQDPAE
jgi:hypothetical protein